MSTSNSHSDSEKIIKLLRDQKTKELFDDLHRHIIISSETMAEQETSDDGAFDESEKLLIDGKLHPASSVIVDFEFDNRADEIADVFRQQVIGHLEPPYIITLEDLCKEFYRQMRVWYEDFDSAYEVFVGNIGMLVLGHRESDPMPVFTVQVSIDHPRGRKITNQGIVTPGERMVWSKNGIAIKWLYGGFVDFYHIYCIQGKDYVRRTIYAGLSGVISETAYEKLHKEISRLLPSIIVTISSIASEEWPDVFQTELPCIKDGLSENQQKLLTHCLDSYYSSSGKKQDFERRIQNAIRLLMESDAQTNDAVGLALAIAAVEALLAKKGPELATSLADYVARLLELDLKQRGNAKEFVKNLYDIRSRTLHGERLDGEEASRRDGRRLAAAVLAAIVERRDFLLRAGYEPETPDQLFEELKKTQYDEGLIMGISESPVRKLWRKEQKV